VFVYTTLLRFDLTMVPLVVATMTAVGAIATGIGRPYPGALPGSLGAAVVAMLVGWWWFQALRRAPREGNTHL
jgi:TRAP-type mannitol/chloroaromatic compound transport system permease large subunit